MHIAAKIGMLIWSILCFLGACSGMMNVARTTNGQMSNAEAAGAGIGLFIWMLIWFFPMVGMGIVALVTRPKRSDLGTSTASAMLCPHCGKYYAGPASFCPICGKEQNFTDMSLASGKAGGI